MIAQEQITHGFFVLGVLAAAVVPRLPSDQAGFWSIGGRLSRNFRKLLLVLVVLNFCRLFLSDDVPSEKSGSYQLASDLLGVVEVTGLTFLCFGVPYILQLGLSQFFNIRQGQGLLAPLFLATILSFLGVALSRAVHPNFWALKKLANAVTARPVIQTLRQYHAFSTQTSHLRGSVFAQTVLVIEYWHLILQLLCTVAYALNRHNNGTSEETLFDRTLQATRSIAFAADWTRVLMHATFLNQLDEMHHTDNFNDDVVYDVVDSSPIAQAITPGPPRRSPAPRSRDRQLESSVALIM